MISAPFEEAAAEALIGRFVLRPALAPPPQKVAHLARSGVVVITDDERGIARNLEDRLARSGHHVVRVVGPAGETAGATPSLAADLGRPEEVARLVERLREQFGRVVALVHLAALRPGTADVGFDLDRWRARLASDLEGFFMLTQALQPDLEAAAGDGGAAVLAATELGGTFAVGEDRASMFPGHGGLVGFLKTLAEEWTTVRVKAVDLAPASFNRHADWVASELFAADGIVEVGYRDERRYAIELDAVRLDRGRPKLELSQDSVVLVTGGARGITGLAAQRLAEQCRPTLVLLGRTRLPEGPEPPETAALSEAAQLKRAIIDRRRREGQGLALAAVEAEYEQLRRQREVHATLAQLREAGASVQYVQCDVADSRAFAAALAEVYRAFGRIDGVIHGAGIVEDKLVRDKKLDSFRRVIRTKVDSALTLAANLRPESLRFLVYFSSVSGRFGNRGQADYAAASEILNKLAVQLDRQWPGHVVSMNWGPWLTTGMATPEIQRQFAERGVELISPTVGCRRLIEELDFGSKGDVEVVVGGFANPKYRVPRDPGGDRLAGPTRDAPNGRGSAEGPGTIGDVGASSYPLLLAGGATFRRSNGRVEVDRALDPAVDRYLDDHRLDGRPVLPGAMALELIAEAASAGWPGRRVAAVRRLRLLRGVVLDQGPKSMRIVAEPIADRASAWASDPSLQVVRVAILPADNARQAYYDGVVELAEPDGQATVVSRVGPGDVPGAEPLPDAQPLAKTIPEVYRDWLFHGPRFQNIVSIDAVGPAGASATFRSSLPSECLAGEVSGAWLIDPVIVDCCLQLQIVWARLWWDVTSLFTRLAEYRDARQARTGRGDDIERRPMAPGTIRCELRVLPDSMPPTSRTRQYLYGPGGAPLAVLDGTEMTGSSALNRLCDGPTPAGPR